MPRRIASAVHFEGGLFPVDLLERLTQGDLPGQRPADFGLSSAAELSDEIAAVWNTARAHWEHFQRRLEREPEDAPAPSLTRELWVDPLLRLLGFHGLAFQRCAQGVDNPTFAISHLNGDLPVHIESCRTDLDRCLPSSRFCLSPHALVKDCFNRTKSLWGIITSAVLVRKYPFGVFAGKFERNTLRLHLNCASKEWRNRPYL